VSTRNKIASMPLNVRFSFIAKIYLNLYSSYFSRVSFIESVIFVKLKCIVNKENQCYDLPIKIITYSGI
jgi:hypothetical protein